MFVRVAASDQILLRSDIFKYNNFVRDSRGGEAYPYSLAVLC